MLKHLSEAVTWRLRRSARAHYLRTTFRNGEELVQSYYTRTSCETAVCRDGTVIHHPTGRTGLAGMILEVWYDEVYTGRFYTPKPGDVIIDAGANIGLFSLLISRKQPGCRVLAFEPFEENYRLLQGNLTALGASMVQTFRVALSGESGAAAMLDGGGRSQDHRLTPQVINASSPTSVHTFSLADVLAISGQETVAMFKCDIEGSERDLFERVGPEHLRRVQRYAIEYHDNIHSGTMELLQARLRPTHTIDVRPAGAGGYGMLYAVAKTT